MASSSPHRQPDPVDSRGTHRWPGNQFSWDAPSPSQAEVEELIRLFPDVIQVPVSSLESEIGSWGERALLARTLSRWVPAEAIIRELHRAGIPGDIEVISLAHRHYLIRLSESIAKDQILGRPWVINGQVLAVAEWMPEFVPSESSLLQALVWIRLPLLPIEFWAEDILSSIISVAGEFLFSDESTRARKRGGFARVCARVDLGFPLRPGARVRGIGDPFWQQFSFENIDGICNRCASLHLAGPCASSGGTASPSDAPKYGPWMAAVRRRRPPQEQSPSLSTVDRSGPVSSPVSKDGWIVPKKTARRLHPASSASLLLPAGQGVGRGEPKGSGTKKDLQQEFGLKSQSGSKAMVPVPIVLGQGIQVDPRSSVSVPVGTVDQLQKGVSSGSQERNIVSELLMSECAEATSFPKLGLGSDSGRLSFCKDPVSATSKRARPVDNVSGRVPSRSSKGKGKAPLMSKGSDKVAFIFGAASVAGRGSAALSGPGAKKARGRAGAAQGSSSDATLPTLLRSCTHDAAVNQLKQAILVTDSVDVMDSVQSVGGRDTGPLNCSEVASGDSEVLIDPVQVSECRDMGYPECAEEMVGVMIGALPNPDLP